MREGNYTAIKETEADTPSFEITAEGIRLKTAESIEVTIYTTNGTLVERIDNYTGESIILDKGIYILKAGNKTMKLPTGGEGIWDSLNGAFRITLLSNIYQCSSKFNTNYSLVYIFIIMNRFS